MLCMCTISVPSDINFHIFGCENMFNYSYEQFSWPSLWAPMAHIRMNSYRTRGRWGPIRAIKVNTKVIDIAIHVFDVSCLCQRQCLSNSMCLQRQRQCHEDSPVCPVCIWLYVHHYIIYMYIYITNTGGPCDLTAQTNDNNDWMWFLDCQMSTISEEFMTYCMTEHQEPLCGTHFRTFIYSIRHPYFGWFILHGQNCCG